MTSSNTYFILKIIGPKTSQQVAVKNFDSSSSPNFNLYKVFSMDDSTKLC